VTDDVWAIIHPCRRLCARGRAHACMRGWHKGAGGAKGLVTCDLLIGGMGGEQEGRAGGMWGGLMGAVLSLI